MGGTSGNHHLQMQAAIMRSHDLIGEAGGNRQVRLADAGVQQPLRADGAADLLVIGKVQFDGAVQRNTLGLQSFQRLQRIGIGGEVGFRNGHTAPVHHPVDHHRAIGIDAPARARGNHIAMRVQRDHRPLAAAEAAADYQIGGGNHAIGGAQFGRHRITLHREAQPFQQFRCCFRMRRAIARRIIGRHAHQCAQEILLRLQLSVQKSAQRVVQVCHLAVSIRFLP